MIGPAVVGYKPAKVKLYIMSSRKVKIFSNSEKTKTLGKISNEQLEKTMQNIRNIIGENTNHYEGAEYYIIIDGKINYISNDTYKKVRQYIENLI